MYEVSHFQGGTDPPHIQYLNLILAFLNPYRHYYRWVETRNGSPFTYCYQCSAASNHLFQIQLNVLIYS